MRTPPQTFRSTCSYCGVGCGLLVRKDRRGRLHVAGDPEHPVNRGMLCSKGLNLAYAMENQGDRLTHPELRWGRSHARKRVSWDTAMRRAAAVFSSLIGRYGPDSVGFYVSGQCLTEEYYLANKLVKGFLGTNNIDTNSRLCMSSAAAAYTLTLGDDCVPTSYDDIEAADCFLISGANPAWCHPILFRRLESHKESHPDCKVIVVDPRRTESCVLADLHLQIRPGTDVTLHGAIARVLIERRWIDRGFIARHVDGFDEFECSVMRVPVHVAAERCGVPADQIVLAARWIAEARGFLALWAMGLNQSSVGVAKNTSLIALNLITGHIGTPGSGPFSLTGQPNAMGGREVGGMSTLLAAHRRLGDPAHRAEVARFWGVDQIRAEPGLTATEMVDALEDGRLKALWIVATNPVVSLPDVNRAERALGLADFIVVQDISRRSDTLAFADLVLPAAGHFEKEGTMTNSERRVSLLERVVAPPGEALPDAEILMRFARAMGFPGFDFGSSAEVFDEHARLTAGTTADMSGLSHDILRAHGPQRWPFPRGRAPGDAEESARLFADGRFHTGNRRAKLHPVEPGAGCPEATQDELQLTLTTGRLRDQWHTMTKTGKVSRLRRHIERPSVTLHPDDAALRGVRSGDVVRIWNARGEVRVPADLSEDVGRGVAFLPMHWGLVADEPAARANNLTSGRVDPVSKQPDFKLSAVQVSRLAKAEERIIVIGAGAGAYRFVNAYRELDRDDEIHVFSAEPHLFYDRVRLPEYVSERYEWHELEKFRERELDRLDLHLHASTPIVKVDRASRTVIDDRGREHAYGTLVVATGSRAFVPPGAPIGEPGVLTMRTRADAEALKARLRCADRVLVVGGGLLGLELAAALIEIGVGVTVVERGARLMERQLDEIAAELLARHVTELGIDVHLRDEALAIRGGRSSGAEPLHVTLKSGVELDVQAVVLAVGTRPNIELLAEAGLACGRGVLVDDRLRTSDPFIRAVGEIAEHRGVLHGITAAAEEQAEVAARSIAGDVLATYAGSVAMNVLKLSDLDLCSIGLAVAPAGEPGYEEIVLLDRTRGHYKKCIVKDDRLVGAILVGDKAELADFRGLVATGLELAERRDHLLRSTCTADAPIGRIVCSCGNVGEGNIERATEQEHATFEAVCAASGAGVGCGSCKPEIRRLLDRLAVATG